MDNLYKYYKELPPVGKAIVVIGGGVILYLVGKPIYKKVFPSNEEKIAALALKNTSEDLKKFVASGLKQSYPDSQYNSLADSIYNAQRTSLGNDSGTIKNVLLKMNNNLDVAKLIQAYGIRQNYAFMIPTEKFGLLGASNNGITQDLFGAFSYRVSEVNNDWSKKGITYKI
jgi:hypothetical protein